MKKIILIFLAFIVFVNFLNAQFQWQQTNGPYGGFVTCINRVQNEIWIGTPLGIYVSVNEGQNWQKYSQFNTYIKAIESFNDTIIIAYDEQLYDSLNGFSYINCNSVTSYNKGNTWAAPVVISLTPCSASEINFYKIGKSIIVDDWGEYLITHDYGQNWETVPIPYGDYYDLLSTDGKKVILRANYMQVWDSHIFLADNDSLNWHQIDSSHNVYQTFIQDSVILLTSVAFSPSYISYIIHSPNLGMTWDTVYTSTTNQVDLYKYIDNKIYANIGIVSQDGGLTWNTTSFPIGYFYQVVDLSNGDILGWGGWSDNIVRYIISSNTTINSSTGFTNHYITNLWKNNNTIFASTQQQSLFSTNDNGQSWPKNSFPFNGVNGMAFKGDTAFCVSSDWQRIGISFNNGLTWDTIPPPSISTYQSRASLAVIKSRLYYSGDSIFYSDNCGLSWNLLPSLPSSNSCGTLAYNAGALKAYKNQLFAVTDDGYVFKFNTITEDWTFLVCFPTTSGGNNFLYVLEDSIIAVSGSSSILISNDQGMSWTQPALNGIPNLNGVLYVPKDLIAVNGKWYGSCFSFGVFMSSDHGNNWQRSFTGTNQFVAGGGLVENDSILFAGTYYNSVWKLPLSPDAGISKIYKENQLKVFPNPTTNYITIENDNTVKKTFTLTLMNIQGQQLLSEKVEIDKTHILDLSKFPNGIYFLTLQNEKENYVSKVVVQR